MSNQALDAVLRSVRPALQSTKTTEEEREQFVYDLLREVHTHVKFDVHGHAADSDERRRLDEVVNAALPR